LARRIRPDLKLLFASGYADVSRFESNLNNHTLLKKPFKLEPWPKRFRAFLTGLLETRRTTSRRCGAISCERGERGRIASDDARRFAGHEYGEICVLLKIAERCLHS
jgi:hypothetical protein